MQSSGGLHHRQRLCRPFGPENLCILKKAFVPAMRAGNLGKLLTCVDTNAQRESDIRESATALNAVTTNRQDWLASY